jgi:hypothetical protein
MTIYSALYAWWLTHLKLIVMLTCLFARRWQGSKSLWREILWKNLETRSVSFIQRHRHRVLADLTQRAMVLLRSLSTHILLDNDISFLRFMFVCFCMQSCWADGRVGANSLRQLVLVCLYDNLLGQMWGWCTLEPGNISTVHFIRTFFVTLLYWKKSLIKPDF